MSTEDQVDFIKQNVDKDDNTRSVKQNEGDVVIKSSSITFLNYRLLKTFFLFLSWICLGLFSEILGPSLPSLRNITGTNYEEISRALTARAAGLLSGSLVGGILSDRFLHNRSLLVFIFLSLAGITVATIPLCKSLKMLSFNLFISGFSHGAFTTAGNPLLGSLWVQSTGPYNFMHSGYGLGAAVAPVLLTIFDSSTTHNGTLKNNFTNSVQSAKYIQPSFNFVGIFCIVIALIFLAYCFIPNPVDELEEPLCRWKPKIVIVKKVNLENGRTIWSKMKHLLKPIAEKVNQRTAIIFSLCFVSYFGIVGNERVFGKFQFTYATEGPLKISKSNGFLINGLYWVAFCVARLSMAAVAIKVSPKILLIVEIGGAIISSLVFTIWNRSQMVFFIFSTAFGFFKSPLFPTMLGVLNLYTTISGVIVILVNFGSAGGAMSCQYVAGYLMEYYGHYTFPVTVLVTGLFLALIFVVMLIVTRKWGRL